MEKVKMVEIVIQGLGLSSQEVVDYWIRQGKVKTEAAQENLQNVKNWSVVNLYFPVDDIRSQTHLLWYAFEGGKFSPDSKAYPNCQGVVGWINPDPNAPEGERIYVVLPEQQELRYSNEYCVTRVTDLYDGRANTKKLIDYGRDYDVRFPAAEYAFNYCKNGIKQGEAFLPAKKQLERVTENRDGVKKVLKLIGGTFKGWLWASSEYSSGYAMGVHSLNGSTYTDDKGNTNLVSCFLAY